MFYHVSRDFWKQDSTGQTLWFLGKIGDIFLQTLLYWDFWCLGFFPLCNIFWFSYSFLLLLFLPNTLFIISKQFNLGTWTHAFVVQDWMKMTCRFQVLFGNFLCLVTISLQTARKKANSRAAQKVLHWLCSCYLRNSIYAPVRQTLKHAHKFNCDYSEEVLVVLAGLGPQNCQTAAFFSFFSPCFHMNFHEWHSVCLRGFILMS